MSGRFTVHGAFDLRLLTRSVAETDQGQDRMVQRKDRHGHPIRWEDHEDGESQFGWVVETIDPVEREFASNLRPVCYRSRQPVEARLTTGQLKSRALLRVNVVPGRDGPDGLRWRKPLLSCEKRLSPRHIWERLW